jgi:hypothetical protein
MVQRLPPMHRPLWQIVLTLLIVGFVVRSGAAAVVAFLAEGEPSLLAAYAFQTAAGVATALGLWLGRPWVLGALVVLAVAIAASAFLESLVLGIRPLVTALGEVLIVAVATGALFLALRREFAGAADGSTDLQ